MQSAVVAIISMVVMATTNATASAITSCSDSGDEWKVCERYPRQGGVVTLYYGIEYRGNGGWGYEHIYATRGWTARLDSYIRTTVAIAEDAGPAENGKNYLEANPNNEPGCKFTVVVNRNKRSYEPAAREIETAYGNGLCGTDV